MLEPIILFALGGAGYQAIELAWRGTTHWTMFAAGGACLCLLQQLARRRSLPLGAAALCGAAAASGVELGVGLACRYLLHLSAVQLLLVFALLLGAAGAAWGRKFD